MANNPYSPYAFHDVTSGRSSGTVQFPAGPGWDEGTGWGSWDWSAFAQGWLCSPTCPTPTPTPTGTPTPTPTVTPGPTMGLQYSISQALTGTIQQGPVTQTVLLHCPVGPCSTPVALPFA